MTSILRQRGNWSYEILLIDDASTDNTQEVIRSLLPNDRIRVITHERNHGHALTINEGLQIARGAFIARIDPDDRYRQDFLSQVMPRFADHPEVGLVYGDAAIIGESGELETNSCDHIHKGHNFKGNELVALMELNFICAPTVIGRREAWLTVPPVPAWLAFNDWYFTLHMARRWEFFYIDSVLADYRVHANNHHTMISRDKSEERSVRWLLEELYRYPEVAPALERVKQQRKASIYASNFKTLGVKYFGHAHYSDSRRCFLSAIRHQPRLVADLQLLRLLLGTIVGPQVYHGLKSRLLPLRRGLGSLGERG